jgi:serine/threonine protein kinase
MCGKIFGVKLVYEYFQNSLQKEIDFRSQKNKYHFSVQEITRILYDLVDVFSFLQANKINHGEIVPSLIFLVEDLHTGLMRPKVCERLSGCGNFFGNAFQGMHIRKDLYISPSLFESIVSGKKFRSNKISSNKSEVFALGNSY